MEGQLMYNAYLHAPMFAHGNQFQKLKEAIYD